MPYTQEQVLGAMASGVLPARLGAMVVEGDRDPFTGDDRIVQTPFVDPRVSGSVTMGFVLARGLAAAWRRPEDEPALPFQVLVGTVLGPTVVRELPVEEWTAMGRLSLASDGSPTDLECGSVVRKFVAVDGSETLHQMFRLGETQWAKGFWHWEEGLPVQDRVVDREACAPGVLSVRLGTPAADPLLARMRELAGATPEELAEPCAVLLMLFAPANPQTVVGDGAGSEEAWRGPRESTRHMSGTHVTRFLAENLAGTPDKDTWSDDEYRAELYKAMVEENGGAEPTLRDFLDTLACASPMRRLLPKYLTRFFPEVEMVFHCCGDPTWDEASPAERFALLVATAQEVGISLDFSEARASRGRDDGSSAEGAEVRPAATTPPTSSETYQEQP